MGRDDRASLPRRAAIDQRAADVWRTYCIDDAR
jgi:hypothetical protein